MANPLAKSIISNIAKKVKKEESLQEKSCRINQHYEILLKDVMHKGLKDDQQKESLCAMKWDDYLGHFHKEEKQIERKEVNAKRMMTLEEFSCKRFKNK